MTDQPRSLQEILEASAQEAEERLDGKSEASGGEHVTVTELPADDPFSVLLHQMHAAERRQREGGDTQ